MRSFVAKYVANNGKWLALAAAAGCAVVAYLAFGVFGIHTLFIDKKVDEAGPVFDSQQPAAVPATDTREVATTSVPATDVAAPAPEQPAVAVVEAVRTGRFVGKDHPASGVATVLTDGTAQRFLRFEEFETDNGPDLNVYLSAAPLEASDGDFDDDFIDLGNLKGNIGDQNYEIPEDVDLDRYTTVVIWCVRFGVPFGAAELA